MFVTRLLGKLSQPARKPIDYDSILKVVPYKKGITRSIMQTCRLKKDLPEDIIRNIQHICSMNPMWSYHLYEDHMIEKYILLNYGNEILKYYLRISDEYGAAKADLFRYLYIYNEGGVYLDIKSSITKPLDNNVNTDDSFLLSYWDNLEGQKHYGVGYYSDILRNYPRGEIPQWFIISSKGHPILRDIIIRVLKNIDNYNPYVNGVGWSGTVYTTGPVPYSLVIYENISKYEYKEVDAFNEIGLQYSIFEDTSKGSTFHAKAIKSDYRKGTRPLIKHENRFIAKINDIYLRVLAKYGSREQKD